MIVEAEPPFGAFALPPALERLRRAGAGLGAGPLARRGASAIRRIVCLGRRDPFDVEPFPRQRARLYPRDNLSEKRVFTAPATWDRAERAAIARAAASAGEVFRFVDAGANVGLYTLAARAAAPRRFRGLAIEPDAENLRRLRFNLAASGADDVTVAPVALSDEAGEAVLSAAGANRGEIALGEGETGGAGPRVPTRPLVDLVTDAGMDTIDALKIDIEGHEEPVLTAFLRDAPDTLRPGLIVIEAQRGVETPALALLAANGYVVAERTKMNAILTRSGSPRTQGKPDGQA
jgi:FkbM family methyltransferase